MSNRSFARAGVCAALAAAAAMTGCTGIEVEDCPKDGVLGNNELGTARLRTSHYRVVLDDAASAAARVLPYALMSAYAYRVAPGCADPGHVKVDGQRADEIIRWLAQTTDDATKWSEQPNLELHDKNDPNQVACEDDEGLMFHVWQRRVGKQTRVVIAFRGTSGGSGDWIYGNLWWITRFIQPDNQLTRARGHAERIIKHYVEQASANGDEPPRFVATGHSLGGSLAQQVLYSFPEHVEQAIVFDPSSVTGFADVGRERQLAACSCQPESLTQLGVNLGPEARILRVYQTYEVLSNLRLFHKLFFVPERHVQEIRFPFPESDNPVERHSMQTLATNLYNTSGQRRRQWENHDWFASQAGPSCTAPLRQAQNLSCERRIGANSLSVCPQ